MVRDYEQEERCNLVERCIMIFPDFINNVKIIDEIRDKYDLLAILEVKDR